ncbi:glycosyltransferase [Rheinheimera sp.]|uniref:glycosyltransferase n=1 Tax=Rheinheimera sp. TaxID=1869214 RepID=UPI0023545495|nr:glycosyltransferase [Rheinheimera sp.]
MTMRVALLPEHFGWGGGADFLRHIINGLAAVADKYEIAIYLAVKKGSSDSELYEQFLDYTSHTQARDIHTLSYTSSQSDLSQILKLHQITIVLPVNSDLGESFPVPWVGYIPDFQHKYLFQNFSERECFVRETAFSARLRDCKALLVNSEAVRQDILSFYPWVAPNRIFSLPYSPHPIPAWLDISSERLQQKYGTGDRYFMLCNQFWIHKDHPTAFRAFAGLADSDVQLVCTGTLADYRRPEYIEELNQLLDSLNIRSRVKMLGHIPKQDQIALLKGSLALIQPTLFEGGPGGGAVYDAVSLGVPVILSDIRVNQEVVADHLDFFPAGDAKELGLALSKRLKPTIRLTANELLSRGARNQACLGEQLYRIIQQTLEFYQRQTLHD